MAVDYDSDFLDGGRESGEIDFRRDILVDALHDRAGTRVGQ